MVAFFTHFIHLWIIFTRRDIVWDFTEIEDLTADWRKWKLENPKE